MLVSSPGAPAGDAHALDDVDAKLTDVDEEEDKEAEGAVTPAQGEGVGETDVVSDPSSQIVLWSSEEGGTCGGVSPERSVEWPVPADERARREEQEPEDGEAEVYPATAVHAEPGQAAHQVGQQRPSVNWEGEDARC